MAIHPGIKLRHLRIFLSVVEHGSLSGAADGMGVSQPSISKAIGDLEAMLEVRLLDRGARGVVLTGAGAQFRDHAARAIKSLDAGSTAIRDRQPGTIAVGLLPTVAGGFFPQVALPFTRDRSGIALKVTTGAQTHLLQDLCGTGIDLMLGRMPDPSEMPGLRFDWLYDEDVLLVGRRDHPGAGETAADVLRRFPMILPPRGAAIRRSVDDYLASQDLIDPDVPFQTVSLSPALRLLELSDMVWFISRGVVQRDLDRGDLRAWNTGTAYLSGAVGITRREEGATSVHVRALCAALQSAAQDRAVR